MRFAMILTTILLVTTLALATAAKKQKVDKTPAAAVVSKPKRQVSRNRVCLIIQN